MQVLRWAGAAGSLLFLGGLAALGASPNARGDRWTVLGLTLVACHPAILNFLVRFQIDGWAYALTVLALLRFKRCLHCAYRHFEFGLTIGLATFLCPKLALLPPLVVAAPDSGSIANPRERLSRRLVAYLGAFLLAAVSIAVARQQQQIGLEEAFDASPAATIPSTTQTPAFQQGLLVASSNIVRSACWYSPVGWPGRFDITGRVPGPPPMRRRF